MLVLLATACAGGPEPATAPPPELQPPPSIFEEAETAAPSQRIPSVEELAAEAEQYYGLGLEAQEAGRFDVADRQFDAAIQVYMDADIPANEEAAFREAFNSLVTRVQAQQLDDLTLTPADARATKLRNDEIPALSSGEINMLRTRIAGTLPAMPRFSIPVPADNPRVLETVEYLTTERRDVIEEGLSRGSRFLPLIREVFAEAGLPAELAYIPLIESLYKPAVRSRASAVGLWQLMAPTARLYGLTVNSLVDERRDPIKATYAITQFIRDYYQEFGDWHLTIAAYNGGKGRVARALSRAGVDNFWSLATTRHLPRETREFVPKILAAMLIGSDPEAYGLQITPQPPFAFDAVAIDTMTDLEVIADAAGTSLAVIRELNPQLLRRTTPKVDSYTIRVPEGSGSAFRAAFAAVPVADRLRVAEHVVGRGETLSHIADEYGLSWRNIADFNGIRDPRRLRPGQTLMIPMSQATGAPSTIVSRDIVRGDNRQRGEKIVHTVRSGENLWLIARAYDTRIADIKRWNNLTSDRLNRGDRLEIYYGTSGPPQSGNTVATAPSVRASSSAAPPTPAQAAATTEMTYRIRRGDTLADIAKIHGVTISDLKRWNALRSDRIYPGNELTIYTRTPAGQITATYTIRRGDSLYAIALRFGVSVNELCAWNGISPRSTLYPGNRLLIRAANNADR